MVPFKKKKQITKALIRLRGCAGWSAPVLFAIPEDRVSRDEVLIVLSPGFRRSMEKDNQWDVTLFHSVGLEK